MRGAEHIPSFLGANYSHLHYINGVSRHLPHICASLHPHSIMIHMTMLIGILTRDKKDLSHHLVVSYRRNIPFIIRILSESGIYRICEEKPAEVV